MNYINYKNLEASQKDKIICNQSSLKISFRKIKNFRQKRFENTMKMLINFENKGTITHKFTMSLILLLLTFTHFTVLAQQGQFDAKRGSQIGASFAIGDFETVNTTNGNLMLNFPLGNLPAGRGELNAGISLFYNSKIYDKRVEKVQDYRYPCTWEEEGPENCRYYYKTIYYVSDSGGWKYATGYRLEFETRLTQYGNDPLACRGSMGTTTSLWTEKTWINKLFVVFPDGSKHEMIPYGHTDALYDGYFRVRMDGTLENCGGGTTQTARPVYYSVDGTYLRLESTNNSWTLHFSDGRKVVNTDGQPQKVYDRNNNYTEYRTLNDYNGTGRLAYQVADQSNRTVTLDFGGAGAEGDALRLTGFNGEELVWKIKWKSVYVRKYYQACEEFQCPSEEAVAQLSTSLQVVDKITEPAQLGGKTYQFQYNGSDTLLQSPQITTGLGEVSGITLPSGAQINYAYLNDGLGNRENPFYSDNLSVDEVLNDSPTSKTLTYNIEYDGISTPITEKWLYSCSRFGGGITNPDGSGSGSANYDAQSNAWNKGLTYKSSNPDGSIVEKVWAKNSPINCDVLNFACANRANPYVKTEYTSIKDSGGNFTKTAIKDYKVDKNGNITQIAEYDWIPYSSVPRASNGEINGFPSGLTPQRVTLTAFHSDTPEASNLSTDPDMYLFSTSPQLKNRTVWTEIKDGSGNIVSRSEFVYDNPSTTGNLIEAKTWDSSKGGYSNPLNSGNSVSVTNQYDSYGNLLQTTDARGIVSKMIYGAIPTPTGSVSDLYPTQMVAAFGTADARTTQMEYDFSTGAVKKVTDVDNNVSTETEYDALARPVKVKAAAGTANEIWTQTIYDDVNRRVISKADIETKGDARKVGIQHFDQLGRVRLTRTLEDAATQSATDETQGIKVQTRYRYDNPTDPANSNGSYALTSNPYRAATSDQATNEEGMGWSLSYTDATGKNATAKTYGGAALPAPFGANANLTGTVTTAIDANTTTVTDQAGKQRRSITNGLGQLVRVDEPDDAGNLGAVDAPTQATSYSYDTLNNLTQVVQGVQTRNFAYDSLSRLKQATNPESGTIAYAYDAGGNLTQKTDARNVVTTYLYDNLNRVTQRSYSDGTPTVSYTYDDAAIQYAKGKLTKVSSSVSETRYNSFDNLGRLLTSQQITDGQTYNFGYAYNLSGMLTQETYPSGRVVTNQFEADGDLAQVTGSFQGQNKTYVGNLSYTSAGAVASLQLGNGRWENTQFNSRLQPTQIGLGNSQSTQDLWKVNYDYGTTDNNGNVKAQTITVPNQFTANQVYTYDSLNRLKSANETVNSQQTWQQVFTFDRYGNRKFDASQTTTLGNCPTNICNPDINPANNRVTTHQFDNAGNTTQDAEGRQFFYDGENKQKEVKNAQGITIGQYLYDGDGKRVKKISDAETTIFVYDAGGKLASEYTVSASQSQAPTTSYLTNDTLGSPRVTTDQTGNVVSRRDFRPYGEEISRPNQGTDSIRQKFTSYERDVESNLDYAVARYFGSSHGRFTSPDPALSSGREALPQSWNRYVYALNNPLRFTDPLGLYEFDGSVDSTQQENFRKQLKEANDRLKRIKKTYDKNSDEYKQAKAAIDSYGCEAGTKGCSEKVGSSQVIIKAGKLDPGVGATAARNSTDTKVEVTLDATALSKGADLVADIAHEGVHVQDHLNYINSSGKTKVSDYDTEFRGYLVTSVMDEAYPASSSSRPMGGVSYTLYDEKWKTANPKLSAVENVRDERKAAIDKLLAVPKSQGGLYEVTPSKPGNSYFP